LRIAVNSSPLSSSTWLIPLLLSNTWDCGCQPLQHPNFGLLPCSSNLLNMGSYAGWLQSRGGSYLGYTDHRFLL
jgi:hypothetical protein